MLFRCLDPLCLDQQKSFLPRLLLNHQFDIGIIVLQLSWVISSCINYLLVSLQIKSQAAYLAKTLYEFNNKSVPPEIEDLIEMSAVSFFLLLRVCDWHAKNSTENLFT